MLLYASPKQESPVPALLASPSIIPVAPREAKTTRDDEEDYVMSSPNEPHLGQRIVDLLHSHVLEPIGTGLRFIHLMFYFLPVIASWPMVLIGGPVPELDGERWGAIWWYCLLTKQMQKAGPTFIKVCETIMIMKMHPLLRLIDTKSDVFQARAMGSIPGRYIPATVM